MNKLKLLSITLACVAAIAVLFSFSGNRNASPDSEAVFLDYKPIPWPCLLPSGNIHSYVNGCEAAAGSYCTRGICPAKTNPGGPPGTISKGVDTKAPLKK